MQNHIIIQLNESEWWSTSETQGKYPQFQEYMPPYE